MNDPNDPKMNSELQRACEAVSRAFQLSACDLVSVADRLAEVAREINEWESISFRGIRQISKKDDENA